MLPAGRLAVLLAILLGACSATDPYVSSGDALRATERAGAGGPVYPAAAAVPAPAPSGIARRERPLPPNAAPAILERLVDGLPPAPRSFTLAFTGDTLAHSPTWAQALRYGDGDRYDYGPMFSRIAPIVASADLAICHLESPIAPPGEEYTTAPMYGVPAEVAAGLASAGYDRCSTASNHTIDRGTAGIDATVDALEAAGLAQSGMARTPEEAATPPLVSVNGVVVAHLSYTWSFNGLRLPDDQPWRSNLIDPERIVADAAATRAAGAEYVIVSLHFGVEGSQVVSGYQRDVAGQVTASGLVDMIVGHHAHVLQPIEQVNGRWVAFGLGNFLSSMTTASWPPQVQDGAIVVFTVTERAAGFVTSPPVVHPTYVDRHPYVVRPVLEDLADPAVPAELRPALEASLARTRAVLGEFVPAA